MNTGICRLDAQLMVTREQIRMTAHWLAGLDLLLGISCRTRRLPGLSPTGLPSCGHSTPRMFSMLPHMCSSHHLQWEARRDWGQKRQPLDIRQAHAFPNGVSLTSSPGSEAEKDKGHWWHGSKSLSILLFLVLFTWVLSLFFSVNRTRGLSVLKKKQLFIFYFYIIFISIISSLTFIISFLLLTFGFVLLFLGGRLSCLFDIFLISGGRPILL